MGKKKEGKRQRKYLEIQLHVYQGENENKVNKYLEKGKEWVELSWVENNF